MWMYFISKFVRKYNIKTFMKININMKCVRMLSYKMYYDNAFWSRKRWRQKKKLLKVLQEKRKWLAGKKSFNKKWMAKGGKNKKNEWTKLRSKDERWTFVYDLVTFWKLLTTYSHNIVNDTKTYKRKINNNMK